MEIPTYYRIFGTENFENSKILLYKRIKLLIGFHIISYLLAKLLYVRSTVELLEIPDNNIEVFT